MLLRQAQHKATLLLIDGNSLFHRAYHALPPLTDRSGENANAVFGFSNMLIKAVNEIKPNYVACAFDTAAPTFRHVEFEKYKAQRPPPPPDLYPQLPKVKKVLDSFGVSYFEKEGYEADDLLATLASKAIGRQALGVSKKRQKPKDESQKPINVIILSGDRDVLQLVNGYIKVQMPSFVKASEGKPDYVLYGRKEVIEKFGIEPRQMVDYKSLIGDSSDNVPGVAGIGPKTAASLLQKYDDLETVYRRIDEIGEKVAEKLREDKEVAIAAKKLVELDTDVDLRLKIKDLRFEPEWESVREAYKKLGFKSIVAKLPEASGLESTVDPSEELRAGSLQNKKSMNSKPKTDNRKQLELI